MSGAFTPTVAFTPLTTDVAQRLLASMAALNGAVTDYNIGSQIRTQAEAIGSVVEMEGVATQADVLQGMIYGALSLFGIVQSGATAATGVVLFSTAPGSGAPVAPQAVPIPSGTVVQTAGGIQALTVANGTLTQGASGVSLGVIAAAGGTAGNVPAQSLTQLISSVGYPLSVTNPDALSGGSAAPTASNALALFTAKSNSLGLASPVAIANAVIGVSGQPGETVEYSSVFEPWIAAGSGVGSGQAGFTLYVDDGTGSASSALLSNVKSFIAGSQVSGQSGYRPVGVPFGISGVVPIYVAVSVTGTLMPGFTTPASVISVATTQINDYFAQQGFTPTIEQAQLAAITANAALGFFTSLTVSLSLTGGASVQTVTGGPSNRAIMRTLTFSVS